MNARNITTMVELTEEETTLISAHIKVSFGTSRDEDAVLVFRARNTDVDEQLDLSLGLLGSTTQRLDIGGIALAAFTGESSVGQKSGSITMDFAVMAIVRELDQRQCGKADGQPQFWTIESKHAFHAIADFCKVRIT